MILVLVQKRDLGICYSYHKYLSIFQRNFSQILDWRRILPILYGLAEILMKLKRTK